MSAPRSEYEKREAAWSGRAAAEAALSGRYSTWRGWLGIALAGIAAGAWGGWWPPGLILVPVAVFAALAIQHERVARRQAGAETVSAYYRRGLERIDGKWQGKGGSTGEHFADPEHVYADDLDLFGRGSLFELISLARTLPGEAMLAAWLKSPAPLEQARARQAAVKELCNRVDLREDLAMAGEAARADLHDQALRKWAAAPPVPFFSAAPWALALLALINLAAFLAWAVGAVPSQAPIAGLFLAAVANWLCRDAIQSVSASLGARPKDLNLLAAVMHRLERESFQDEELVRLRELLTGAAVEIARLERLVELLDSGRNQMFAIPAFFLVWAPQLTWRIEQWRQRNGPRIGRWIDAVSALEALSSLAGFAFEHPSAVFPQLAPEGTRVFDAAGLAHPLLAESAAVPNDLSFGDPVRLVMISGSNMSGKSTLLRAAGLNTVLAWAGAPVRAGSLRISPFALGASIRATDSLLEGRSRFYAEILRLKQIQKLTAGPLPALFLLDELLSGTNSHDREIGAGNYLNGLVARGAVGMATTHDLALTQVAAQMGERAMNVHLADTIAEGEVLFDYRLRPGVVARGNALALMRAVGLDVAE